MAKSIIFIRVDSSETIGTGHFWRCYKIARKLTEYGKSVEFITASMLIQHRNLLNEDGYELHDISTSIQTGLIIREQMNGDYSSWLPTSEAEDALLSEEVIKSKLQNTCGIIIDHYAISKTWEEQISKLNLKIIVIDDLANRSHNCSILIDQNSFGDISGERYRDLCNFDCKFLLGSSYFMGEFQRRPKIYFRRRSQTRILVYAGGTNDPKILQKFATLASHLYLQNRNVKIDFLFSKHLTKNMHLMRLVGQSNGRVIKFSPNFSNNLRNYDFMIGAGGTTLWEREYYNLPSALVSIAENQVPILRSMASRGSIVYLGHISSLKRTRIVNQTIKALENLPLMRFKSRQLGLVDGLGLSRVTKEIASVCE